MSRSPFTQEEDLRTLSELLPEATAAEQLGRSLKAIQAATTPLALERESEFARGYVQALKDMKHLSDRHAPDLRELVTRARLRCAIT